MSLQDLKKMLIESATSLNDVEDSTIYELGLSDEQINEWHARIERARDIYVEAVLSIDAILER